MGRYGNYPTTVEDTLTFRLKTLFENKNTYFNTYGTQYGITSWSVNGTVTSKINIIVHYSKYDSYILFDYLYNGEPINYKVNLEYKKSNLGKGKIWFMVCPYTQKLCRKLHLQSGLFLHRTASKNLMYKMQLESKKNRSLIKAFEMCIVKDEVYYQLNTKYFKTHYKGKTTKKYLKIQNKINRANKNLTKYYKLLK